MVWIKNSDFKPQLKLFLLQLNDRIEITNTAVNYSELKLKIST